MKNYTKNDAIVKRTGNENIANTLERFRPRFNAVQNSIAAILLDQRRVQANSVKPTLEISPKQV